MLAQRARASGVDAQWSGELVISPGRICLCAAVDFVKLPMSEEQITFCVSGDGNRLPCEDDGALVD